jgi:CheY-like chemotaxis protein
MKKFKSVLLIDDDQVHNFLANRLIKQLELSDQIVTFQNGQQGIDYIEGLSGSAKFPELILLDLNMPVRTGVEFLESLKNLGADLSTIQIIIISALVHSNDLELIKNIGVNKVLIKPITKEKLLNSLN